MGIFIVTFWWFFWHSLSFFQVAGFVRPSLETNFLFLFFYFSIYFSYFTYNFIKPIRSQWGNVIPVGGFRLNTILILIVIIVLLVALYLSKAFSLAPYDYFLSQRGPNVEHSTGTGIKAFETFLDLVVLPLIISISTMSIASLKYYRDASIVNILISSIASLMYSYLYQTNTAIVFVFFIFFCLLVSLFFGYIPPEVKKRVKWIFLTLSIFFIVIMFAAINRFGAFDLISVFAYYPVSYFTLSFTLFDINLNDSGSLLHDYTYGESTLGYISLYVSLVLKTFLGEGFNYISASSENVQYNSVCLNVGADSYRCMNAFGSILFSFYRDFGVLGVWLGGGIVGLVLGVTAKYSQHFKWGCLNLYLLTSLMLAICVSPFDLPYFWTSLFLIVLLCNFRKVTFRVY
ncbi:hypothetical protein [Shewanella algae]|uniref:hypothetical protein n=1 Tax=Shewanella algae TaxID=38313 RepID=UPI0027191195|nr:hypothetical protein [Shewanella algae]MDO8254149.1 hypothetical protein [Shewanella algae]